MQYASFITVKNGLEFIYKCEKVKLDAEYNYKIVKEQLL
jgi:hypothetical protein